MLLHQDQIVHISTEIIKLKSERRSAVAERTHLDEELKMIEQLMSQLKERPTFTAADEALTVAFVPYTQIDGVESGAPIYDCIWGLFHCNEVGRVTKLLPGEVILPDPWGTMTRGQYATMTIDDAAAAKSRTLRVRPQRLGTASLPKKTGVRVAVGLPVDEVRRAVELGGGPRGTDQQGAGPQGADGPAVEVAGRGQRGAGLVPLLAAAEQDAAGVGRPPLADGAQQDRPRGGRQDRLARDQEHGPGGRHPADAVQRGADGDVGRAVGQHVAGQRDRPPRPAAGWSR